MPRTELHRRITQRETLQKMHETAEQEGDEARDVRIVASIHETDARIEELKTEAEQTTPDEPRRRRR